MEISKKINKYYENIIERFLEINKRINKYYENIIEKLLEIGIVLKQQ